MTGSKQRETSESLENYWRVEDRSMRVGSGQWTVVRTVDMSRMPYQPVSAASTFQNHVESSNSFFFNLLNSPATATRNPQSQFQSNTLQLVERACLDWEMGTGDGVVWGIKPGNGEIKTRPLRTNL